MPRTRAATARDAILEDATAAEAAEIPLPATPQPATTAARPPLGEIAVNARGELSAPPRQDSTVSPAHGVASPLRYEAIDHTEDHQPRLLLEVQLEKPAKTPNKAQRTPRRNHLSAASDKENQNDANSTNSSEQDLAVDEVSVKPPLISDLRTAMDRLSLSDQPSRVDVVEDDLASSPSTAVDLVRNALRQQSSRGPNAPPMTDVRPKTPPSHAVRRCRKQLSPKAVTPHFDPQIHIGPALATPATATEDDSFVAVIGSRSPAKMTISVPEPTVSPHTVPLPSCEKPRFSSPTVRDQDGSSVKRIEDTVTEMDALDEAIDQIGEALPAVVEDPNSPVKAAARNKTSFLLESSQPQTPPTMAVATASKAATMPAKVKHPKTSFQQTPASRFTPSRCSAPRAPHTPDVRPTRGMPASAPRLKAQVHHSTPLRMASRPLAAKVSSAKMDQATDVSRANATVSMPRKSQAAPAARPKARVSSVSRAPFVPVKSSRTPTRPTFSLPSEAISARQKAQREERRRQEEIEAAQKRSFKARPLASSAQKGPVVRATAASRARISCTAQGEKSPQPVALCQRGPTVPKLAPAATLPRRRPARPSLQTINPAAPPAGPARRSLASNPKVEAGQPSGAEIVINSASARKGAAPRATTVKHAPSRITAVKSAATRASTMGRWSMQPMVSKRPSLGALTGDGPSRQSVSRATKPAPAMASATRSAAQSRRGVGTTTSTGSSTERTKPSPNTVLSPGIPSRGPRLAPAPGSAEQQIRRLKEEAARKARTEAAERGRAESRLWAERQKARKGELMSHSLSSKPRSLGKAAVLASAVAVAPAPSPALALSPPCAGEQGGSDDDERRVSTAAVVDLETEGQ